MKKYTIILFTIILSLNVFAQKQENKVNTKSKETNNAKALNLAKSALTAHGGEKFKAMKSLSIIGSVDITVSSFNQAFPASFTTVFSGDKYRLEINGGVANFKQVFDGNETFTSPQRGFSLPPINRLGLQLLQRLGDEGYQVSDLSDKKKTGFRLTSPEGYYSDFYMDKKTNMIKGYDASYIINNREATTSVEIDKLEEKEGIQIPVKYSQRFDFGEMTVYVQFKAKEILLNTEISNDVFAL
jgi:hypothetical protein